jgi:four helix bundle protein
MARGSVFMSTSPPSAAGVKEVDMKTENLLPFQKLDIYIATKEFSRRVQIAKLRDRELRDQATRAAKSCFLCLSEGLPNDGPAMRHKYFVEARNSLCETVAAVDLASAIGAMRDEDADAIQALGARIRRMLGALLL